MMPVGSLNTILGNKAQDEAKLRVGLLFNAAEDSCDNASGLGLRV